MTPPAGAPRRRPSAAPIATFMLAAAALGGVGVAGAIAQPRDPLTTAEMLVDAARDHGLRVQGRQTDRDVTMVRALLRAAARLDPRQRDAHALLYELAVLAGDAPAALAALDGLLAAEPENEFAFAQYLEYGQALRQTLEEQQAWLGQQLPRAATADLEALVHVRLCRLALRGLDRAAADEHLARARALAPDHPDVALAAAETLPPDAPAGRRLAALLSALRGQPLRVELAWAVGELLDEAEFHVEAAEFYDFAAAIDAAAGGGQPMPPDKLVALSRNALARGETQAALEAARKAAQAPAPRLEHLLYYCWLAEESHLPVEADAVKRALAREFAAIKDPDEWPVDVVAQAAWFHCTLDLQRERALMLAEAVIGRAPDDPFALRVLGWAQAVNLKEEAARQTLQRTADKDPYSAYQLAALLRDQGDADAAADVVARLERFPSSGPAYRLLASLRLRAPDRTPPDEKHPDVAEALEAFDRGVLAFAREPTRYLAAEMRMESVAPGPGQPWWAVFELRNAAPYPVTLGIDGVVNPVFLLSFSSEGDRPRSYPYLMTISFDRYRRVPPGGAVRVRRTLDVGPLARACRHTPQQLQRITVSAILDPQRQADGSWKPCATGQTLRPVTFNQVPALPRPELLNALFADLRAEAGPARYRAIEACAALFGEAQRAAAGQLAYRPDPVPTDLLRRALLACLSSESWETRARVLEALHLCGLDAEMVRAVEARLQDEHWLVRALAVRQLARRGAAFAPTAARVAVDDPDELVRDVARAVAPPAPASAPSADAGAASRPGGSTP